MITPKRMTPERLAEVRAHVENGVDGWDEALLAHIDVIEAERRAEVERLMRERNEALDFEALFKAAQADAIEQERASNTHGAAAREALARAEAAESARDTALAQLAALREAAQAVCDSLGTGVGSDAIEKVAELGAALADTAAAARAHDERVRRDALEDAARRVPEAVKTGSGWYGITDGQPGKARRGMAPRPQGDPMTDTVPAWAHSDERHPEREAEWRALTTSLSESDIIIQGLTGKVAEYEKRAEYNAELVTEARAQLAALREAAKAVLGCKAREYTKEESALRAALSTPSEASAAYVRRVRGEALEDAARALDSRAAAWLGAPPPTATYDDREERATAYGLAANRIRALKETP